jgi:hypothetical protein
MGDAENRGVGVYVNGDNLFALAHAGLVLNGAAYADGDVETGPYGCAGLTYLVVTVDEAKVHGGPCGSGSGSEAVGEVPDEPEVFLASYARTASYDYSGGLEVNLSSLHVLFQYLDGQVIGQDADGLGDDLWLSAGVRFGHGHYAFTDGSHLRPAVEVDDCGDDVAAEGGANLEKQILIDLVGLADLVVADLQVGAVGGKAGFCGACDSWGQVAPAGCGAIKYNLGLVFMDQIVNDLSVRIRLIMFEQRMLSEVNPVGAVIGQPVGECPAVLAQEQGGQLYAKLVGELSAFAQKFNRSIFELACMLLGKDPNLSGGVDLNHIPFPFYPMVCSSINS